MFKKLLFITGILLGSSCILFADGFHGGGGINPNKPVVLNSTFTANGPICFPNAGPHAGLVWVTDDNGYGRWDVVSSSATDIRLSNNYWLGTNDFTKGIAVSTITNQVGRDNGILQINPSSFTVIGSGDLSFAPVVKAMFEEQLRGGLLIAQNRTDSYCSGMVQEKDAHTLLLANYGVRNGNGFPLLIVRVSSDTGSSEFNNTGSLIFAAQQNGVLAPRVAMKLRTDSLDNSEGTMSLFGENLPSNVPAVTLNVSSSPAIRIHNTDASSMDISYQDDAGIGQPYPHILLVNNESFILHSLQQQAQLLLLPLNSSDNNKSNISLLGYDGLVGWLNSYSMFGITSYKDRAEVTNVNFSGAHTPIKFITADSSSSLVQAGEETGNIFIGLGAYDLGVDTGPFITPNLVFSSPNAFIMLNKDHTSTTPFLRIGGDDLTSEQNPVVGIASWGPGGYFSGVGANIQFCPVAVDSTVYIRSVAENIVINPNRGGAHSEGNVKIIGNLNVSSITIPTANFPVTDYMGSITYNVLQIPFTSSNTFVLIGGTLPTYLQAIYRQWGGLGVIASSGTTESDAILGVAQTENGSGAKFINYGTWPGLESKPVLEINRVATVDGVNTDFTNRGLLTLWKVLNGNVQDLLTAKLWSNTYDNPYAVFEVYGDSIPATTPAIRVHGSTTSLSILADGKIQSDNMYCNILSVSSITGHSPIYVTNPMINYSCNSPANLFKVGASTGHYVGMGSWDLGAGVPSDTLVFASDNGSIGSCIIVGAEDLPTTPTLTYMGANVTGMSSPEFQIIAWDKSPADNANFILQQHYGSVGFVDANMLFVNYSNTTSTATAGIAYIAGAGLGGDGKKHTFIGGADNAGHFFNNEIDIVAGDGSGGHKDTSLSIKGTYADGVVLNSSGTIKFEAPVVLERGDVTYKALTGYDNTDVIPSSYTFQIVTGNVPGGVILTSVPSISSGTYIGQTIKLEGDPTGANWHSLSLGDDRWSDPNPGTNIWLANKQSMVLDAGNVIQLHWDGSKWIEDFRSVNYASPGP